MLLAKQTVSVHGEHADNKPENVVSVLHPGGGNLLKCDICKVETHASPVKNLETNIKLALASISVYVALVVIVP